MKHHEILFRWNRDYEKWIATAYVKSFITTSVVKIGEDQFVKVEWDEEEEEEI